MQLIYADETGINYQMNNDCFKDGPYQIYGAICIDERKYFHLERLFIEVIDEYFSIADWRQNEIHASDIWQRKNYFEQFKPDKVKLFFNEIMQLLTKLNIVTLISYKLKTKKAKAELQSTELIHTIYSFFHLIEMHLSSTNDTGIIICDKQNIKNGKEDSLFSQMFYDRTMWRTNPKLEHVPIMKSQFAYESRSCFILDDIHYVDSKKSLFTQISDISLYVTKRLFNYLYLLENDNKIADNNKIPVPLNYFIYHSDNSFKYAFYNWVINDVVYHENIQDVFPNLPLTPVPTIQIGKRKNKK